MDSVCHKIFGRGEAFGDGKTTESVDYEKRKKKSYTIIVYEYSILYFIIVILRVKSWYFG